MSARTSIFPRPGWATVTLAAALAMGAAACGQPNLDKAGDAVSKPVVLTLADGQSDTTDVQPFASAVSRLSHGALQIKIEGGWRPTDPYLEPNLIKDVQAGKVQLGIAASWAFDTVGADSFQALQAPFLIDSYPLEQRVLESGIPVKMLAGLNPHGLVGLAVLPGPLRRPLGFTRPLLAASSYRGARIEIPPSQVTSEIFRALGAIPVIQKPSRGGWIIAGLTGIEGHANTIDSGLAVPHAVLTGNVVFEPRPSVIFMNRHAFSLLTAGQRTVLYQAAVQARAAGIYQGDDTTAVADLCRRGIKIVSASPADLAGLQAAEQPVYRTLETNSSTRVFVDEITAMRETAGGNPDAVSCPSTSTGGTATVASGLQGTWRVSYTEGQLVAAGADSSELVPSEGNWGHFTLTLRQSHWWLRYTGGDPATLPTMAAESGTYIAAGTKITFYRHDNAYSGSNTEIWGPYIWSVYRDMLTFKKDGWTGGTQGPTGLVVTPWRKTGA